MARWPDSRKPLPHNAVRRLCNRLHPTTRFGYGFAVLEVQFERADRFTAERRFRVLQPCAERTEERGLSSGFHDGTYRY